MNSMDGLSLTLANGLVHYFEDFQVRVRDLAMELTDEQFWTRPYPYGNSFGNLVLHLKGNLSYYIGTQIENTGYVRDREIEFTEVVNRNKTDALADLDATVTMVIRSLRKQEATDWSREYRATGVDDVPDRFNIFLRCCVHFHHHIGQMTYLVKEWDRQSNQE